MFVEKMPQKTRLDIKIVILKIGKNIPSQMLSHLMY